jgi:hypothetical protein
MKIKTKFRMALPNAITYVENFPEDVQNRFVIIRDLEARNRIDYIVCELASNTFENFITSDGYFLSKRRHVLALCEINNKNLKKE